MAQLDVHRNNNSESMSSIPYLLDVQSGLLSDLATRVVVPLVKASEFGPPVRRLNPVFEIDGVRVVMSTAELAGVPKNMMGETVGTLDGSRDEVIAAVDFIIRGF